MTKKILILLLAMSTTLHLSGCSSSGSKEEGDVAQSNDSQFPEEGEGDFAQQSEQQSQDGQQAEGGTDVADESAPQDQGQDLALDGQQQQQKSEGGEQQQELALDDPQPLPEDVASAGDPAAQPPAEGAAPPTDPGATAGTPPSDEPLFKNSEAPPPTEIAESTPSSPTDDASSAAPEAPAAPKSFAPLQKMKDAAFDKNGTNLNRVYVARQGDTMKSVVSRLFGSSAKGKQKELKAWNPILNRGVKTGDKIYYPSQTNPEDTRMMTYYEDLGIQPQVYTTKDGDNIRKLAKQFLGSSESWKEVWSTNPSVESKGDVPAGVEIKYWPEEAAAQALAQGGKPGGNELAGGPGSDPMMGNSAPPPPPGGGMASNDIPPPPPGGGMDSGMPGDVPPPPPGGGMAGSDVPPPPPGSMPAPASTPDTAAGAIAPPPEQVPPPPPPPEPKPIKKAAIPKDEIASSDPDTMMAMGLGGILLMAAAVLFVVLRKNRARKVDLGQTQV